jgi:tetratricopeptide (TPR) repeat protein
LEKGVNLDVLRLQSIKSAALTVSIMIVAASHGQELVGAKQTVKQFLAAKNKPAPGELSISELIEALGNMEPKAAGEKWASTYLRNRQRIAALASYSSLIDFPDDLVALPGPETWPAIDAWFKGNNSPLPYQLLGSYLVGDRDRQRKLIFQFAAQKPESYQVWRTMLEFGITWGDKEMVRIGVERSIAQINKDVVNEAKLRWGYRGTLDLPKLSGQFEPKFVTEIIKNALEKTHTIVLVNGQQDFDIAVALARKDAKNYPIARYELIQNVGSGDLYPLLEKWFPKADSINKQRALAFYTQSKILRGNSDIVWSNLDVLDFNMYSSRYRTAIVQGLKDDFRICLERPAIARKVLPLLKKALVTEPDERELRMMYDLCGTLGQKRDMLPLLRKILGKKRTQENDRLLDAAAMYFQKIEANNLTDGQVADLALRHFKNGYGDREQCLEIGKLLHRQDLIAAASKTQSESLASLFELKKYRQIEDWALKANGDDGPKALLRVYNLVGKHQDVVDLLDTFPDWQEDDLLGIRGYIFDGYDINISYEAGKALIAVGNWDAGLPVLRHSLKSSTQVVEAYNFFAKTLGDDAAIKEFDKMFAADPLDSNPLIWKAKILLRQGRVKDAEKETLKALKIDPLNGNWINDAKVETQKLMGEILAAQGKKEESHKWKSAVEATRLVELGDKFCEAGLTQGGIGHLRKATIKAPNSFYAHARLASELYEAGRIGEAKPHYKRAFQLLPSSFGAAEGLPYRLDYTFLRNPVAKSLAQEVLTGMLKQDPQNPRINYHMGALMFDQGRHAEAVKFYLKAIEIDPSYLMAYEGLGAITDEALLTSNKQEEFALARLKIDPNDRHEALRFYEERILNLKNYYLGIQKANQIKNSIDSLYPLRAAAQKSLISSQTSDSPSERTPGRRLMDSVLLRAIKSLVDEKDSDIYE